jgi:hypothetical protein
MDPGMGGIVARRMIMMIRGDQWVEYLRAEFILVASDLGEMSRSNPENQEGGSKACCCDKPQA